MPPGDDGYGNCPKSVILGLRLPDEDEASLCRSLREFGVLGRPVMVESLYKVDESAVLTEVVGDPGRTLLASLAMAYARSLSALFLCIEYTLNSVPVAVRVGFVMGAEMADVGVRRP